MEETDIERLSWVEARKKGVPGDQVWDLLCVQLASYQYLERGPLMRMMPLHVYKKSDYDIMIWWYTVPSLKSQYSVLIWVLFLSTHFIPDLHCFPNRIPVHPGLAWEGLYCICESSKFPKSWTLEVQSLKLAELPTKTNHSKCKWWIE